ncbi:MAG: type II secretion system F family protein, partial [Anaerolineae bacterium]|nr:type II secretion system F family protein [Anaerolineae bacterium]
MAIVQLLIGLGLIGILGALVYVGLRDNTERDPLEDKLAMYGEGDVAVESLEEVELQLSIVDRIISPAVRWLADRIGRLTPRRQLERAERLIELANMTMDPATFTLMRIGATIGLGILALVFAVFVINADSGQILLWTGGGIVLGYMLPEMSLRSRISRRQREIVRYLPDALDLLVICVEAGLGFDAAMGRVYEKWDNEISLAFGRVLREIQLGMLRRDALKSMADRIDVPDMNSFVAAIIQAEQLGVSMSKILRVQSDQMRTKRRQRAQEKAQQAPVKMMIPM